MTNLTTETHVSISAETDVLRNSTQAQPNYFSIEQPPATTNVPIGVPNLVFGPAESSLAEVRTAAVLGMLVGAAIGGVAGWLSAAEGNESRNTVTGALLGGVAGTAVAVYKEMRRGQDLWKKMDLASHASQLLGPMSEQRVANWQRYQTERYSDGFLQWLKDMPSSLEFENDEQGTTLRLQSIMSKAEESRELRGTFFKIGAYAIENSQKPELALAYMELEAAGISPAEWKRRALSDHARYLLNDSSLERMEAWTDYWYEEGGTAFAKWLKNMIDTVEMRKDPPGVLGRLSMVMEKAESSAELREELFSLACEYTDTCTNRVAQGFNEMELAIDDYRLESSGVSTKEFLSAGMAKLRLVILKHESKEMAARLNFVDGTSMHFYLVSRLANSLDLPDAVYNFESADRSLSGTAMAGLIDSAKNNVLRKSNEPGELQKFLLNEWRPWPKHVERVNGKYFEGIQKVARGALSSVEDEYAFSDLPLKENGEIADGVDPDLINPSRYDAFLNWRGRMAALENYCDQSRNDLIKQLTVAYLDKGTFDEFDFDAWNQQYIDGFAKFWPA